MWWQTIHGVYDMVVHTADPGPPGSKRLLDTRKRIFYRPVMVWAVGGAEQGSISFSGHRGNILMESYIVENDRGLGWIPETHDEVEKTKFVDGPFVHTELFGAIISDCEEQGAFLP